LGDVPDRGGTPTRFMVILRGKDDATDGGVGGGFTFAVAVSVFVVAAGPFCLEAIEARSDENIRDRTVDLFPSFLTMVLLI
jgi:hypothetical protein